MDSYRDLILSTINTIVKSSKYCKGIVIGGILTICVNNGIVYTVDMRDQIPPGCNKRITKIEVESLTGSGNKSKTIDWVVEDMINLDPEIDGYLNITDMVRDTKQEIAFIPDFRAATEDMFSSKISDGEFRYFFDTVRPYSAGVILSKSIFNLLAKDSISLSIREDDPMGIRLWYYFTIQKVSLKKTVTVCIFTRNLYCV